MKLSSKEAARRLLRSAIKGYVQQYDPLVVHLCAQSALRIARDVVKKVAPDRDLFSGFDLGDQTNFLKDFSNLNNFLKHADRGPEEADIAGLESRNASLICVTCRFYEEAFGVAQNERTIVLFQIYRLKLDPLHRHTLVIDLDPDLAESKAEDVLLMIRDEFDWDDINLSLN